MKNSFDDSCVRLLTIFGIQPHYVTLALLPLFIIFLLCSIALLGGAETAMFSLSPKDLDRLKQRSSRGYNYLQQLLERPRLLLTTIAIIQIFFNVLLIVSLSIIYVDIYIMTQSASFYLWLIAQMVVVTIFLFTVQYIIPRSFAERRNVSWTLWILPGLYFFGKIFAPVARLAIRRERSSEETEHIDGESVQIISHDGNASDSGPNEKQEVRFLKGVIKFGNTHVKEIMKSRMDVVAVDIKMNFDEVMKVIKDSGYSRLPVYQETLDNIVGILYTKDLLDFIQEADFENWQKLLRVAFFVPEGKRIPDLLLEFQTKMIHMAIVVDEYGSTAGIVTLEDIVEEIIGDIRDEMDEKAEFDYAQLDKDNFIFEGKTLINDIYRAMNISNQPFDKLKGDIDSIGGLVLELCGKIPAVNEEIDFENYRFKVLSLDKQRIKRVKVSRFPEQKSEEN